VSAERPLVIDIDATLVTSHSDKEQARPTFKRGFGHHPLWAFADHGHDGTGEPLAVLLRPGNAGSNTAADHIAVLREALHQIPGHQTGRRPGRKVLVRIDGAGATHQVLDWLSAQRLSYSLGYGLPANTEKLLALLPKEVWQVAYDSDGSIRDGAWVAELIGLLDLTGWPSGMRVIARKERPHPGAQLRFTDADRLRVTAFATNTSRGQLADLELQHRRRARCENRIRNAKDTGPDQAPAARHGPEQDLVRGRQPGLRAHRLAPRCSPFTTRSRPSTPRNATTPATTPSNRSRTCSKRHAQPSTATSTTRKHRPKTATRLTTRLTFSDVLVPLLPRAPSGGYIWRSSSWTLQSGVWASYPATLRAGCQASPAHHDRRAGRGGGEE